jgi:protein TonB
MSQTNAAARALHRIALGAALAALPWIAQAQFTMVPSPECKQPRESAQEIEREFRLDASRHLYGCYPARIYKGKLPPMLYGVMVVNVELDAKGNVVNVNTIRPPAAPEVGPWVESMVRKASPFPAPVKMAGARFTEIFLVDKSGRFQTDSLTEGQR